MLLDSWHSKPQSHWRNDPLRTLYQQYGENHLEGNSDVSLQNASNIFLLSYSGITEGFHRTLLKLYAFKEYLMTLTLEIDLYLKAIL